MAGFSDAEEIMVLQAYFAAGSWSPPGNLHLALSTTEPLDGGTGVLEPVYGDYLRQPIASGEWSAATGSDPSYITNSLDITFPEVDATTDGAIAKWWALMSAPSGGLIKFSGLVTQPPNGLTLSEGVIPQVNLGSLICKLG